MRRSSALLLLAALLGGLGAASVHRAQHAVEWAEAQRTHAEDHHETGGDHASTPCTGGDLHALDCAICSGLGGAVVEAAGVADEHAEVERQREALVALGAFRRAATPARGPPTVA
ncbi:hypothetical protein [Rubrivirga sp.]|uniref:hypothetical protein n=1 Tax=Rubrivirga sp. TaxID=1885344 RepID=UPI003B52D13A